MSQTKEEYLSLEHFNTYIELVFSMMCIRHPKLHSAILELVPGVQVASSYVIDGHKQDLCIPTNGIIGSFQKEGLNDVQSLKRCFYHVNSMFLVAMWDILTETSTFKNIVDEPDVQFFRHVRNGCAHGNQLNFDSLHKPAVWRDKTISSSDSGRPVFPDILKDGDPSLLLGDINNSYFELLDMPGLVEFKPASDLDR